MARVPATGVWPVTTETSGVDAEEVRSAQPSRPREDVVQDPAVRVLADDVAAPRVEADGVGDAIPLPRSTVAPPIVTLPMAA